MKKVALIILVALAFTNKAQVSFPAAGADWHYMTLVGLGSLSQPYYSNTEIKYTHDTLIGNRTAAVINNSSFFEEEDLPGSGSNYFYTSNDSVFLFNAYSLNKWQLLYSFNTPVGQSWQFNIKKVQSNTDSTIWIVHVDSTDYIVINNVSLKRLYVTYHDSNNYLHYSSSIIERIGDIKYLINILDPGIYGLCDGCTFIEGLLCYQDSTFNLYQPDTSKSCNYTTLGIKQVATNNQLKMYPNPAQNNFTVEVSGNEKQLLQIVDISGKQILQQTITATTTIDASTLNNGVYFIQLKSGEAVSTQKLIVQH